jgi:protein-S-isoprenylcysteine O-methyltransferase Ste14
VKNKTKQVKSPTGVNTQPFLLALIHIAAALVLGWLIPIPLIVPPVLRTVGFLLVVSGFLLGMAALVAFRRARPKSSRPGVNVPLIKTGIYRFTRNPIYLGFLLMLIGISLNAGSYWGLIMAPLMIILFNRLIIEREEETLSQKFGEEYTSYQARIGRWL